MLYEKSKETKRLANATKPLKQKQNSQNSPLGVRYYDLYMKKTS